MGLFGSKEKKTKPPSKPAQPPPPVAVPLNGAQKNRVDDTDKAILDVKSRQRKIRTY